MSDVNKDNINTFQELSLIKEPNQEFLCVLNEQNCTIQIRQLADNFYFTLYLDNDLICENKIIIVGRQILQGTKQRSFNGNFYILDTYAPLGYEQDLDYTQFNERFKLYYVAE